MFNLIKKLFTVLVGLGLALCLAVVGLKIAHKIYKELKKSSVTVRYNTQAPVEAKENVRVFAASSLDRIFQDGKTLLKPRFTSSVSISAARNEYESFQVVVQTENKTLDNVSLSLSSLIDEKNNSFIDASNMSWRVVGYVPTVKPYYPVKYVGPWPDPLMPAKKTSVPSHSTQPFWITIYVPPQAKAGDYKTIVTVKADGVSPWQTPVTLRVYDFELPKQSHLKTAFDFYGHITKTRYPQQDKESDAAYQARLDELNDDFIVNMIKYRENPILNIDPTSQADLSRVDRYMVYGLNNFSIGKKGGTFNNNWPKSDQDIEDLLPLYQTYGEDLKLNRMLKYTYIYTWDEGDMGNPQVAKITSMIHHAYPGLKNMVCYHGLWNPNELPKWGKNIDIWCFNIDDFNEAKMRRLQKIGIEMWMYVSGPSGLGTPNLALDFDSIDYRILSWLCWKYDIKGLLYWCVNWWQDVDPFKNAKNTNWDQNGNGLLFYPGTEGPLASLRAEVFRDGMEDYEYILLLLTDLKLMKEKQLDKTYSQFFNDSVRLLTVDSSIAESMRHFTKDQDVLQARRNAIAEKIEQFNHLLSTQ